MGSKGTVSVLATPNSITYIPVSGGSIFVRADSDIHTLADLKGKKIVAALANSLWGFQAQVFAMAQANLSIYEDPAGVSGGVVRNS